MSEFEDPRIEVQDLSEMPASMPRPSQSYQELALLITAANDAGIEIELTFDGGDLEIQPIHIEDYLARNPAESDISALRDKVSELFEQGPAQGTYQIDFSSD